MNERTNRLPSGRWPVAAFAVLLALSPILPLWAQSPVTEEILRLTAFDAALSDQYGAATAVSGDLVAIGALQGDGVVADTGAVYLYERNRGGADAWGLVVKLTAADSAALDSFGGSLALDVDTLVVGALGNDGAGAGTGAAYVFERNQGGADTWGQVVKLNAAGATNAFGISVAIDGDTIVIGAENDPGLNGPGAAYVFARNQGGVDNWGQVTKLTAPDAAADDKFGNTVSISGNTIAVGSPRDDSAGGDADAGSVYLFDRNDGGADAWGFVEKIDNPDPEADDWFGDAVSVEGDTLAIGAPRDGLLDTGAAYVYAKPTFLGGSWTQTAKITSSDADSPDRFGFAVSLAGEHLLVSGYLNRDAGFGTGSAYLFARNQGGADGWGEIKKLLASDIASNAFYGNSVGLDVDTLVVGAPLNDLGLASNVGSAYVHNLRGDAWRETRELNGLGTVTDEWVGYAVDLDGLHAVAGARREDLPGFADAGAAYVFKRNIGGLDGWGQTQKLVPSDPDASAFFGASAAISGDTVAVGADQKDEPVGVRAGAAYLYRESALSWSFLEKIVPSDPAADDRFGFALALDGSTLVVGAYGKNGVSSDSGAVYVFRRNQGGADSWDQVKKLTASDGGLLRWFGWSVGVSGDTIVVGSPTNLSSQPGAAYVFQRNQGGADNWGEVIKLTSSDGVGGDKFGYGVAISGDRIVVGAPNHDGIGSNSGAAYVFERNFDPLMPTVPSADNWGERKKLVASDTALGDEFGRRVAIDVDTIAVGTPFEDEAPDFNRGSVYLYERNYDPLAPETPAADNWGEVAIVRAAETTNGDRLGDGLALQGMTLLTGAPFGDGAQVNSGAAYVFERNNECLASQALTGGLWKQISLACDMAAPATVQSVFAGSLDPADYGATWIVYRWDPATETYAALGLGSSVVEGQGYWIKTTDPGRAVDANSDFNGVLDVALTSDAVDGRYNMVGHTFTYDVCWEDVRVIDGGVPLTLDAADPGGACQSDPVGAGCVMSRIGYKWSGASYDAFDGQTPGAKGTLEPFDGLWVKAFKAGISLRIPASAAGGDCEAAGATLTAAPSEAPLRGLRGRPADEAWFVRLTARSGELVENGAVFGQLEDSRCGYDSHDLPHLEPFASPNLAIVFPHSNWRRRPGEYATDFHRLRRADVWLFEIRGEGLTEPVTLSWAGPPEILERSVLVDVATGERLRPSPGGSYELTLDGGSRVLRWRLRDAVRRR